MTTKPQPSYARLTQPPRSAKHGRNRKALAQNHSDPLDGAGKSPRRTTPRTLNTVAWSFASNPSIWTNLGPILPIPDPGVGAVDLITSMQAAMDQMIKDTFLYIGVIDWAPPKPASIPYSGIHSGEILGYRGWFVVQSGPHLYLQSMTHTFVWPHGSTIEGDINQIVWKHKHWPDRDIYGGIYAFDTQDRLDEEIIKYDSNKFPGVDYDIDELCLAFAYGKVKLWGEVVQHEKGYRASFAKVASIDGLIGKADLNQLRRNYGV